MSSITLPGFQVLDTLRQTSKSITVKAVQVSLDRTVALTFLRPELASNPNEVRHFLSIGRICAQLKADGLPQIYDINTYGDQPYLIMENVEGLTVADVVGQTGPLAVALSVRIAMTIADALDHAWGQSRLVHRNIKPSEIRIDSRGTPKLTDFGRATIILPNGQPTDEEEVGMVVGTPNFLSPEQVQVLPGIDFRSDIYSLGATLYYMITGHVPFPDSDPEAVIQKQITSQIPHPHTYRPELSANVSGMIARLMMKLPDDRYPKWADAIGDMNLALRGLPLRRRDTPPKGISTVASVAVMEITTAAPELPQLRKVTIPVQETISSPSEPPVRVMRKQTIAANAIKQNTPAQATHDSGLSALVRIALWILLGVWFVLLGNDRLNNPLQLSLPSPLLPLDKLVSSANNQTSFSINPKVYTLPPIAPPANPPTNPPTPAPTPAPTPPAATNTNVTPPPLPKAPEPEKKRLPKIIPPDTAKLLANALARGDLSDARVILNGNIPMDTARLAEYRSALDAVTDPLLLAAKNIEASKGQVLSVMYMGKGRKIIPRNLANDELEADFVTAEGNRPVTLKMSKFTPEELLKLLPARPETPAEHASICLALLKANHGAKVAPLAPYCGILGPLFEAAATQKLESTAGTNQ